MDPPKNCNVDPDQAAECGECWEYGSKGISGGKNESAPPKNNNLKFEHPSNTITYNLCSTQYYIFFKNMEVSSMNVINRINSELKRTNGCNPIHINSVKHYFVVPAPPIPSSPNAGSNLFNK